MALIDNLVFGYKMEDDAANTDVVDVLEVNDGDAQQNTENISVAGVSGLALSFNGSSDFVDLHSGGGVANAFTFSIWLHSSDISVGGRVINFRPTVSDPNEIRFYVEGSKISSHIVHQGDSGVGSKNYQGATTLNDDTWYHYLMTWDGTNLKLYLNGSEDTPYTKNNDDAVTMINTTRERYIGKVTAAGTAFFDGDLHSAYVWSRVLTSGEITTVYNGGVRLDYPFIPVETNSNFLMFM